MGQRVPMLKIKIAVGPFASGQTRTIEYASPLPILLLNDNAELIKQFAVLYERLEATIEESMRAGVEGAPPANSEGS